MPKRPIMHDDFMPRTSWAQRVFSKAGLVIAVVVLLLGLGSCAFKSIPAGHVGVATFFGEVVEDQFEPGLHFPVNPLYKWHLYDARQKTHMETASVPSQDQLSTDIDVSVQYRIAAPMATQILKDTGTAEQAVIVHLIPKVRSLLREQGKTIVRAEDFFKEETQQNLQVSLQAGLAEFLTPRGLEVQDVLIREIRLPPRLIAQIEQKKETEQQAERQKAELIRYETEQQQQVVKAKADLEAAKQEAERRRTLAEAQAFEIQKINEAIAQNPAYIQLESLKALQAISKDPAAKVYFLNGDSPQPLPLMNIGSEGKAIGR
ncbi:MAG: SPFH domain-containing protein [Planctomycetota bacterium]